LPQEYIDLVGYRGGKGIASGAIVLGHWLAPRVLPTAPSPRVYMGLAMAAVAAWSVSCMSVHKHHKAVYQGGGGGGDGTAASGGGDGSGSGGGGGSNGGVNGSGSRGSSRVEITEGEGTKGEGGSMPLDPISVV
jgi:hypothetical protein